MKRFGLVDWFDESKGEGMVTDLGTGKSLYVHWSAIFPMTEYGVFRHLNKHDLVEFTIYRNLYSLQIGRIEALAPDMDGIKFQTCLEMCFRRGIDIGKLETKYG